MNEIRCFECKKYNTQQCPYAEFEYVSPYDTKRTLFTAKCPDDTCDEAEPGKTNKYIKKFYYQGYIYVAPFCQAGDVVYCLDRPSSRFLPQTICSVTLSNKSVSVAYRTGNTVKHRILGEEAFLFPEEIERHINNMKKKGK